MNEKPLTLTIEESMKMLGSRRYGTVLQPAVSSSQTSGSLACLLHATALGRLTRGYEHRPRRYAGGSPTPPPWLN